MLAERARLNPVIILLGAASIVTLAIAMRPASTSPAIAVSSIMTTDGIEITDFCPPHVRAAVHLGDDATMYCVRGQFPEPGTFVFAQYRTTENWERFAVVGDDGHLLVPMLDRPSTRR